MQSRLDPAGGWLAPHRFRSNDLDHTREHISRMFKPHQLRIVGAGACLDVSISSLKSDQCSIHDLSHGAKVEIDPGRLENFYLVMLPQAGSADIETGKVALRTGRSDAVILSPTVPCRMRWEADCSKRVLRMDRGIVERFAMEASGSDEPRRIEFEPRLDLQTSAGTVFERLLSAVYASLAEPDGLLGRGAAAHQLELALVSTLLFGQVHSQSIRLTRVPRDVTPGCVRRAQAYIDAHTGEPLTVVDLARESGVSVRTLFTAFHRYCGTTPMNHLKDVRFARAHEELMRRSDDPSAEVTDVALHWGFNHLSRFASDYRRRFGVYPSDTLRARRAR